jgi:hypothetical protein
MEPKKIEKICVLNRCKSSYFRYQPIDTITLFGRVKRMGIYEDNYTSHWTFDEFNEYYSESFINENYIVYIKSRTTVFYDDGTNDLYKFISDDEAFLKAKEIQESIDYYVKIIEGE